MSRTAMAWSRWHSGLVSRVSSERFKPRWVQVVAVAAVLVVGGCTSAVDGDPVAAPSSAGPSTGPGTFPSVEVDVRERSVTAADFPAGYDATEVPAEDLAAVMADTAGYRVGSVVTPSTCAPTPLPATSDEAVALVAASAEANAGTLSAITVLTDSPLSELEAQLEACPTYTTTNQGATATVTTTVLPPSPAQSQESLAFRRVTMSGSMTQTMTALVAQNDGVRVYVTVMAPGSGPVPDGAALDELYTTAVERSRG
ncbi:UNVERIFIED_CONTAM: hypothetical protein DES50_102255 [Williamsia faeni]